MKRAHRIGKWHLALLSMFVLSSLSSCLRRDRDMDDPYARSAVVTQEVRSLFKDWWKLPYPVVLNFGHTVPDTRYLKNNLDFIERNALITGYGVTVSTTALRKYYPEGSFYYTANEWSTKPGDPWYAEFQNGQLIGPNNVSWFMFYDKKMLYQEEPFQEAAKDLESIREQKTKPIYFPIQNFRHNHFDWRDDEQWKTVEHNLRMVSKFIHDGGYSGVIFDPEEYGNGPGVQPPGSSVFWTWSKEGDPQYVPALSAAYDNDKIFEEVASAARARGRAFIKILNEYNPKLEFYILMGYSQANIETKSSLEGSVYGIFANFINGMLEASSEQTVFIDLCEGSYKADRWQELADRVLKHALKFITVDKDTYLRKMKVGFPLYRNRENPEAFAELMYKALHLSTKLNHGSSYFWIYEENQAYDRDGRGSWIVKKGAEHHAYVFSQKPNLSIGKEYDEALKKAWSMYAKTRTLVFPAISLPEASQNGGFKVANILEGAQYELDIENADLAKKWQAQFYIRDEGEFHVASEVKRDVHVMYHLEPLTREDGVKVLRVHFKVESRLPESLGIQIF